MTQQKKILVDVPGRGEIAGLLKKSLAPVTHNLSNKEVEAVAKMLEGYSMSDIVSLVKEAAMLPVRESANILQLKVHDIPAVTAQHIKAAKKTVPPCATPEEIERLRNWGK